MKNKLLITTALVTAISATNAFSADLPEDAANLTTGSYEVNATNTTINHNGKINLSGDAQLAVSGTLERNENDVLEGKSLFNGREISVSGNSKFSQTEVISNFDLTVSENAEVKFENSLVNGTTSISGGKVDIIGTASNFDKLNVSGGTLNILNDDSAVNAIDINVTGGEININDSGLWAQDASSGNQQTTQQTTQQSTKFNISGGTINATNDSIIQSSYVASMRDQRTVTDYSKETADINISGTAEINLSNLSGIDMASSGDINISEKSKINMNDSFILQAGKTGDINLLGGSLNLNDSVIARGFDYGEDHIADTSHDTSGSFNMTGGELNIQSGNNTIASMPENTGMVNISGGTINIAKDAILNVYKTSAKYLDDISSSNSEKDTINLTEAGTINLSGDLLSHVSGNGTINFDDSASQISGNVSGSNLNFNADHSLSQAITGAIRNLASLNVNKGTLTYDKPVEGSTGNVNVAKGAGLNINSFMWAGELNLAGNVAVNSDVMAQGNINITDGTVNMNGASLNARNEGIKMTGGTVNMNDGGDDPDLTFWAAKDINISGGTINMNGSEASIDTFYDWLDGNGDLMPKPEKPGDVNINGGTVNVNSATAEISSEGKIEVSNGGVINVNSGGVLSSFNSFVVDENGMDSVSKGTINVAENGTINLAGQLKANVAGSGNLSFKSAEGLVDGNVSGANMSFEADHSLSKAISGTIGDLASLNVNKGTLSFDKSTGTIANLNVSSTLDIGTNTVQANNVNFKDNSTLKFTVAGKEDGSYGQIKATDITISPNGTKLDLTLNSSVLGDGETKDFTILSGNVDGEFAQLSENSRYDFKNLGNGQYKITGKASAADIVADAGGTSNNAGTASAWDSVALESEPSSTAGTVAVALADLSGKATTPEGKKAYVEALTAIAPEVAPMVQQTQSETANQVFGAVGTRLSGGSISTGGEGMSSGDNIFERAAVWVQGLFNKSKLDDTSKSYGFDADSNGVAMGAEKYINDNTKVGLGYAYTNTDIDGFMRSTDVDTHTAIVYGEYKPSNWYINGVATYGWSDYEEHKNVANVDVKSKYDTESFGLQAMTGYDMQVKGFGVTPEVGLRYVHISQDAYTDSADQRVSGNDSDILTGVIGAKVTKAWQMSNGMMLKPEARFALTYDLMNDDAASVVSLANGSAYTVEGEALDRFGMEFGAGITAEVNDNVEFSLGYEGKFREDYQDHTGLLNAKYKF